EPRNQEESAVATFETTTDLPHPPEVVFDLLSETATQVRLSPPELHMRLTDGPAKLSLGSQMAVQIRRAGIAQTIVSVVTAFEPATLLVIEQRQGPLKRFVHTHRLEAADGGGRLHDQVDFEPPGGLLGFLLTESRIRDELAEMFAFRVRALRQLLE